MLENDEPASHAFQWLLSVMATSLQEAAVWFVLAVGIALLGWFVVLPHVFYSGPVVRDTPMMREISAMYHICTKLQHYADEHHAFPSGSASGKSVDSLVAAGILSVDDAVYMREYQIEFRGFDPSRIGPDIVVMETVFRNTKTPCRIVGYSDGSVVRYDLKNTH